MDIKKVFKAFTKDEAREIIAHCGLDFDELPIALSALVDHKPRLFTCDEYGLSFGKYHYMLNRIMPKIQTYVKFKLLGR